MPDITLPTGTVPTLETERTRLRAHRLQDLDASFEVVLAHESLEVRGDLGAHAGNRARAFALLQAACLP